MPRRAHSTLAHAPLASFAESLRSGALNLEGYVHGALDRVERMEPVLRALVPERDREARVRAQVEALRRRHPDPASRPALFGVLVGIKDIIAVDGLPTRGGSALTPEALQMPEASVVTRLHEAGAVVLGKTVTAEFASASPGATTNPHDQGRTPGGSSSGSAAGVAAGYTLLAVGSQTGGSVIRPAAFCGVMGFKPSYGRIPVDGVLYHSPSVDTLGIFTQDLEGIALGASVVVDGWNAEAARTSAPVLGVPDGPYLRWADEDGLQAFEASVRRLVAAGVEVRRVPFLEDADAVHHRHSRLMMGEYARVHAERFARWGALYTGTEAGYYDQGVRVTDAEIEAGREGRMELRERVSALMDREGLDALISPSAPGPAPEGLRSTGRPVMNVPWSHAGVPAISLPAGEVEHLPVGLQLVGRFGDDEALLATAAAVQAHL
ncbi:MAG: amidase [Dehalococcoidia bacterium]|nr:amidase [Dehalococcoidia bacterium]